MSARKDKQRALATLARARKAPPKARIYKKTHIAPHMIEFPLAAAIVEAAQKDGVSQKFGAAQCIIERLTKKHNWPLNDLNFFTNDNVKYVQSSKLVLRAEIDLAKNIRWNQGRLKITNITIPEVLRLTLIGKSIKKLIDHPWLHKDILIKSITMWPESVYSPDSLITVELINHQPTIKYALKLLGANHQETENA
jgi:hypothetical protein